jgi:hypothetical protein
MSIRLQFRTLLCCWSAAWLVSSCGGEKTGQKAPAPPPIPRPTAVPAPVVDASTALFVLRWQHPAKTLDLLAKAPASAVRDDLVSVLSSSYGALDLAKPIDVVVGLAPTSAGSAVELRLAAGFGILSTEAVFEAARKLGARERREANGGARFVVPEGSLACALPPARRDSAPRLVCGSNERDVASLVDYLSTTFPAERLGGSDLNLELRLESLRQRFKGRLQDLSAPLAAAALDIQSRNPAFDRALGRVLAAAATELSSVINDVHSVRAEAALHPESLDFEAGLTVKLHARTSRTARILLAQASHAAPAPDAFWRSPADSETAFFVNGLDAVELDSEKNLAGALFGEVFSYQGTPPKLRDAAAELVRALPMPRGTLTVSSAGAALDPARLAKLDTEQRDLELTRARLGWRLMTVEDTPDRYASYFALLAEAFRDPVLGPQMRRFIAARGGAVPLEVRSRTPARAARLPAGSRLTEMILPARELDPRRGVLVAGRKPGMKVVFVVVPEAGGKRTLIGVGADENLLASRLRDQLDPARRSRSLERNAMPVLAGAKPIAGGFFSAAALRGLAAAELPNGGRTPVVYTLDAEAEASLLRVRARAPRAAVTDLSAWWADHRNRKEPGGAAP